MMHEEQGRWVHDKRGRSQRALMPGNRTVNLGKSERVFSAGLGAAMLLAGLGRRGWPWKVIAGFGGMMVVRAASGHSMVYQRAGLSSAGLDEGSGITVDKSISVMRPIEDVYGFWSDVENFPKVMKHVQSVTDLGGGRSRWVVQGPREMRVTWEAEIVSSRPNDHIAWKSLPGSDVEHAGSVHFTKAPADRGTEVRIIMRYRPMGGAAGFAAGKLLNPLTEVQVEEDLREFKQMMEVGEVTTIAGQPMGPRS